MKMQQVCGEQISMLAMGNMRLPTIGDKNGPIDIEKAQSIIDFLYSAGVNYFDTAYMYHGGQSEVFIGQTLKRYPRNRFYLATKLPSGPLEQGRTAADIFQEQLQKCQVEYFDFYLLHNLNETSYDVFTAPEVIPYLLSEKKNGRIRHLGVSSHAKPETLEKFLDKYGEHLEFVQIQLNYFDWEFQNARLQYDIIRRHDLPVWVMEPCRGGRLASLGTEANHILYSMQPDASIASWAFRYLLGLPSVQVILSGMTEMDQAIDNVKTFSEAKPLNPQECKALEKALELFRAQNIVPCTECHYCDGCPNNLDIPSLLQIMNRCRLNPSPMIWMHLNKISPNRRADMCIGCGLCVHKCPQNIQIPALMQELTTTLTQIPKP